MKELTEQQKEFLRLHIIEQENYQSICAKLNVSNKDLSQWYNDLKDEREEIAKVRNLYFRKKIQHSFYENEISFSAFYKWHINQVRECEYCGINEKQISHLLDTGKLFTKRIKTRGRKLEIDRKKPDEKYSNIENLVLACYWCNNAKTDTFTHEEFLEVGKVFSQIWKKRLEK